MSQNTLLEGPNTMFCWTRQQGKRTGRLISLQHILPEEVQHHHMAVVIVTRTGQHHAGICMLHPLIRTPLMLAVTSHQCYVFLGSGAMNLIQKEDKGIFWWVVCPAQMHECAVCCIAGTGINDQNRNEALSASSRAAAVGLITFRRFTG